MLYDLLYDIVHDHISLQMTWRDFVNDMKASGLWENSGLYASCQLSPLLTSSLLSIPTCIFCPLSNIELWSYLAPGLHSTATLPSKSPGCLGEIFSRSSHVSSFVTFELWWTQFCSTIGLQGAHCLVLWRSRACFRGDLTQTSTLSAVTGHQALAHTEGEWEKLGRWLQMDSVASVLGQPHPLYTSTLGY